MKILGLKFRNINSLQGEWEIRFDQPPLSDTGLFAIVGPNGSGKSSILDALTLALYGETARLKSPGLDVINWSAEDSYSEVTFSVGESHYRSNWALQRGAGGQDAAQMQLISLNGEDSLLEDRVIKVRDRISEITGLDFKRFCRSVLLAQGQFSALLHALENERAEILERIIGPEIAQELEEAARTQAAVESEKLQRLRESAAEFPSPDKDQIQAARDSREQLQDDLQENERLLQELEDLSQRLARLETLEAADVEAAGRLLQAESEHQEAQELVKRLERAKVSATPLWEEMKALEALRARKDSAHEEVVRLEGEIESGRKRTIELEGLLAQVRQDLLEARTRLDDRGEEWEKAALLDRKIEEERQRFLDLVGRYEAAERAQRENLQEQAEVETDRAAIQEKRLVLEQWLETHSRDSGLEEHVNAIVALQERLVSLQQELDKQREKRAVAKERERVAAKELHRAQVAAQKVRYATDRLLRRKAARDRGVEEALKGETAESLKSLLQERRTRLAACKKLLKMSTRYKEQGYGEEFEKRLEELKSQQSSLREALDQERSRLADLGGQIRLRDTVRRLSPERSELAGGLPCPLCGSTHHPYVEEGLPDFTQLDRTVQELNRRIEALEEQRAAVDEKVQKLGTGVQTAEKLQAEWAKACAEAEMEWLITDMEGLAAETRTIGEEVRGMRSRLRSARWNRFWGNFVGRSLDRKTEKLTVRDQEREAALSYHEAADAELAAVSREVQRLEEEQKAAREGIEGHFRLCAETLPAGKESTWKEADALSRLRERHEVYSGKREEHRVLGEELLSLEARKESLPRELEELQRQTQALTHAIEEVQSFLASLAHERENLSSTVDPGAKRQAVEEEIARCINQESAFEEEKGSLLQRLQECERQLPQLRENAKKALEVYEVEERPMVDKARSAGFDSLDELREHVRLLEEEQNVLARHVAAQQALEEAESKAAAAREALDSIGGRELRAESPEALEWKIADATKRRQDLQERLEEVEATLSRYRDAEREYREILQAVAAQEKVWSDVIGEQRALLSKDQAERRSKIQRLMLERLIDQSNHYLNTLSGRYSLGCEEGNGLSMVVQDFLQENALRSVETLSGGESFLVSLCLALGLADMAGKHRKIESLFLDEGFGTLDEEMLYRVIAVLKSLRANGKMVGVISHVKRLADEIPTQIRVERMAGGFSRISVVA